MHLERHTLGSTSIVSDNYRFVKPARQRLCSINYLINQKSVAGEVGRALSYRLIGGGS
jgi:hypothetical protein